MKKVWAANCNPYRSTGGEENLDGVHDRGGSMPDGPDITRRWSDGRDGAAEVD